MKRDSDTVKPSTIEKRQCLPKGVAHLKPQYIIKDPFSGNRDNSNNNVMVADDRNEDEENASSERFNSLNDSSNGAKKSRRGNKKQRGQNKNRDNRQMKETNKNKYVICPKLLHGEDVSNCPFGDSCRFNHDIKLYLDNKSPEIDCAQIFDKVFLTFTKDSPNGEIKLGCPVLNSLGFCPMGFKCRFLSHHLNKEDLTLVKNETFSLDDVMKYIPIYEVNKEFNHITYDQKQDLIKRRFPFSKSDHILEIIDAMQQENRDAMNINEKNKRDTTERSPQMIQRETELQGLRDRQKELYLKYRDTRYFASEKRKLDYKGKKILSPLTTVGNLPFRRLMKKFGCDVTYSEMALGVPLIQGTNSEWALPKCHISEKGGFGVQIACSKVWQASKAAEVLSKYCHDTENGSFTLSEINLNAGCPIDLLYRQGSGSALLDNPARLIRCLNGMNYASGDVPITVKIRTGTKDDNPMADLLVRRLVHETDVSGIILHGRSRQQRYTKLADWEYIRKVAVQLREEETKYNEEIQGSLDKHERNNGTRIQFVGNGDVNNWEDWYEYMEKIPEMDSIMVARGALIKPWIWEEIDSRQYLDKSSSERMEILSDYARYAMEHWGTDEYGISQCKRYFCEFMSFFHRYIPMGICERYPVKLNERPPYWQGRDELETKLGSPNVQDWIKLSEYFLGPVGPDFNFTPKHKSNSYSSPAITTTVAE